MKKNYQHMTELKRQILQAELVQAGFKNAKYMPEWGVTVTDPRIESMAKINGKGIIFCGSRFSSLVHRIVKPIVSRVNEIMELWIKSRLLYTPRPANEYDKMFNKHTVTTDIRILAEHGETKLLVYNDTKNYTNEPHFGVTKNSKYEMGSENYQYAKEMFVSISQCFYDRAKIFPSEREKKEKLPEQYREILIEGFTKTDLRKRSILIL